MKITVIGEKCIDEFIYGNCTRLNPEAPTPVFVEKQKKENLGMAANVVENLLSLGDITIFKFHQPESQIIKKTRYVDEVSNYIMLRVDLEEKVKRIKINDTLIEQIKSSDLLVISDYDKGFLHPGDLDILAKTSNISIIDTKKNIENTWATSFDFIKMNKNEWENPMHVNKNNFIDKTIITCGKYGASWRNKMYHGEEVEVMDVVGAGDSFLAGFSHMFVKSKDPEKSIKFGNLIAANAVKQRGVVNKINNIKDIYDKIK